ncbi:MAG: exodeoxyribonuclease V subunit gamma [Thermodesulfobacteriota bacterium]|nr:exodeoxyribonuclease V subunit gamma [Thermodesulfobacteriota bacterium]
MPNGLKIYTGNRLEILAEKLAQLVREPLDSPFTPETIVVQSLGMERWISMALASHNGISANCYFPFPNKFLHDIFTTIVPDVPDDSPFESAVMTFKIMKILPACLNAPGFESIKSYLKDDINRLKLFQLAEKISHTFEQYVVFRPEMIFQWEEGREEKDPAHRWQAYLWRELVKGNRKNHRAYLRRLLLNKISRNEVSPEDLPRRVSLFGISYLPPFHLEVFTRIAQLVEVNLLVLNPCQEYWADIVSDSQIKKIKLKHSATGNVAHDLHLEKGNRLLASMGTLGRDFFRLISSLDYEPYELFQDQNHHNLLTGIQADILYLREGDNEKKPRHVNPDDMSIQIHSCHSPMREVEVLHDQLLAMFEEDPKLVPKDIVVMTPDIETYAPFIHAVFDTPADESLRIPYSTADTSTKKQSRIIDTFSLILDLKGSRLGVSTIMSLMESPSIKDQFGLTDSDIEMVEIWIRETNIRWGYDALSKQKLGIPGVEENTWKAGIERLLLGYAMPGHGCRMFSGILPYDHIEGRNVNTLGKLIEFINCILKWKEELKRRKTLKDWGTAFTEMLEQLFMRDEDTEREIQFLRRIFKGLGDKERISGFTDKVELEVMRCYLERIFEQEISSAGFISTGITFCAMLPMRSIPFKVICLIGMNNDTFPRELRPLGFDLMARKPRVGDRSKRNDDKYLFLEALTSARNRLYISYVGQSIQDNSKIEPSVIISELIDYIEKSFALPDNFIEDNLITQHKLQAFSAEYFREGSKLSSYSRENCLAAKRFANRTDTLNLFSQRLSTPADEFSQLEIETLCAFFTHPARFLLQRRLGIYLDESMAGADEKENFNLKGLQKYKLEQDLVRNRLSGLEPDDMLPVHRASGTLPHGNIGKVSYSEMSIGAGIFADKIESITKGQKLSGVDVDCEVAGFKISGKISDIYEQGLIIFRYTAVKPKDYLKAWIYHLLLCTIGDSQCSHKSTLLGSDLVYEFEPIQHPKEIMRYLLQVYWNGLSQPVHFFPAASYEYARQIWKKGKSKSSALKSAEKKWNAGYRHPGESKDPYVDLCFRDTDPLDDQFEKISTEVFGPIFEYGTKVG